MCIFKLLTSKATKYETKFGIRKNNNDDKSNVLLLIIKRFELCCD